MSIISIVVGALGTIPKSLQKYLDTIDVDISIEQMQTTVLLNTARIIIKVLEI